MKIYHFGHGKTIAWYGGWLNKPTIVFTKNKKGVAPELLGKLNSLSGRKLTFWEQITSTYFIFQDVKALRSWLQSTLDNIDKVYEDTE